ncbi:MAG: cystathionine beta-lyase, partial [Hellea sp.]|nr:cystathionine beta-lyase [Hellea sp.]
DVYGILRGFRTLITRFKQQEETSLYLATWLNKQSKVSRVIHPAHVSHPDHELWKRDFTGGGCIFSAVLKPCSENEVNNFIDRLELFGIGFSYGGYESLCINCDPQLVREKSDKLSGPLIRFACGLENLEDLKNDIEKSLLKLRLD